MPQFTTTCPKCKKVFQIKDEMQGKRCRCANCQARFVIRTNEASRSSEESHETELLPLESTSTTQVAVANSSLSESIVEPEVFTAEAVDHAAERKISSFEKLADKLISARSEANSKSTYDPRKFLAYSTNANLVSRDSSIERSTRLAIHGGAMMLLAVMLFPFVFLGIHLTGWAWTCPLGGLLAAFLGCIGALLTTIALFKRSASSAFLFGFAPGSLFLMSGGLIFFLLINSYWGAPTGQTRTRTRKPRILQSSPFDRGINRGIPRTNPSSRQFRNR